MTLSQIGIVMIVAGYMLSWLLYWIDTTTDISVKHTKWVIAAFIILGIIWFTGIGFEIYDSCNKVENTELINNE